MRTGVRLVAVTLAVTLVAGPLVDIVLAQQPAPSAPPSSVAPSPPQPAVVLPPPPPPPVMYEAVRNDQDEATAGDTAKAAVVNVFRVPGKVILCGFGSVLALGVLALTFGTQHKAAAYVWDEGCAGKWAVSGEDMRRAREVSRSFDWEAHHSFDRERR